MTKKEQEKENQNPKEEVLEEAIAEELEGAQEVLEDIEDVEEELILRETLTPEEIAELRAQLQAAEDEATANMDGWQRAQAEFINYRKRMERDQAKTYEDATVRVIKKYLEVVDDLSLALNNRPQDQEGAEWAQGIELIYRKLLTILENEGVVIMEVEGQTFDPNLHEAISQEESPDHESGQIIEVVKNGYLIGERVLRPAVVRVAS
jgi:molecular chaperone GrpE